MKINDIVDKAYCINLKRRSDRLELVGPEFTNANIDVEIVEAVDGWEIAEYPELARGAAGCLQSQLNILTNALEQNYESVAIFEDDVFFVPDFESQFATFYDQVPDDWQFIYLASFTGFGFAQKVSENVDKITNGWSAHAVLFRRPVIEHIVNLEDIGRNPIDVTYGVAQLKFPAYSAIPSLAGQREDFSDIEDTFVDYNHLYGL